MLFSADWPDLGGGGSYGQNTEGYLLINPSDLNLPQPDPTDPCDTGDDVLDDADIQDEMTKLWKASNATDQVLENRLEQGGFITEDPNTGDLGFKGISELPGDWQLMACGINPPGNFLLSIPANAIGFIHTHPWKQGTDRRSICGDDVPKKYKSGYSFEDLEFINKIADHLNDYNFKGYVLDGSMITRFNSLATLTDKPFKRCGY